MTKLFLFSALFCSLAMGCAKNESGDSTDPGEVPVSSKTQEAPKQAAKTEAKNDEKPKFATGADGSRLDPDGDKNPEAVSKRLMKKMSAGEWSIDRFVQPAKGLVEITFGGPDEGDAENNTRAAKKLCGADLKKRQQKYVKVIAARLEYEPPNLRCQNKPSMVCTVGAPDGEGDVDYDFHFVSDGDKGVTLAAVAVVARAGGGAELDKEIETFSQAKIAELASQDCK